MVNAVYRGNIEELLSVINHLKKYIIVLIIVLLVLLSIFHFSKYSVNVVPLVTVTLVLLPAVYYATVLVLKLSTGIIASSQTSEVARMNGADGNGHGLKTPDLPYPKSPTPPPSYEEATRNDHYYHQQPQPWLPSTSSGYTSGECAPATAGPLSPIVFNVEYQYNAAVSSSNVVGHGKPVAGSATIAAAAAQNWTTTARDDGRTPQQPAKTIQNIPSVTITLDSDQRPMEI